jgi:hypothetical protein
LDDEHWDVSVLKYLDANRHDIHKYLSIVSDIKVQPTAVNPMSSLQSISGINSCVVGAPKVQMEMIPVLNNKKPKMMLTTGAITKKNYTDSKSGKIGDFHHTFGFAIVEIEDNENYYVRQVTADNKTGDFTDLIHRVDDTGVNRVDSCLGLVLGDLHWGHHCPKILKSTMGLISGIKPKEIVLHDIFDGHSINHHEMKDPFIQWAKECNGKNDLRAEIDSMLVGLELFRDHNVIVVRSNHDDFLDRWLKNEDWKKQPTMKNSLSYMELSMMLLKQHKSKKVKGVIPELIEERFPNWKTLTRDSSYKIGPWEVGMHGDLGPNGSRGSLVSFRKLNTKLIVGHTHSPGRKDGVLVVGTTTKLRVGYNIGPSSWMNSHVIIHNDKKAQHINFFGMKYTTFNI